VEGSKRTGKTIKETRDYHTSYLRAVNNPVRRKILRAVRNGHSTFEELQSSTGLDGETLRRHLNILECGSCVEKHVRQGRMIYALTQEGRVIDYMEYCCAREPLLVRSVGPILPSC